MATKKKAAPKKAAPKKAAPKKAEPSSLKRYLVPGVEAKSVLAVIKRPEHDIVIIDAEFSSAYEALINGFPVVGSLRYSDQQFAGDRGDEYILVISR